MQCPVCTTVQLVMSERQGIEIDYCPNCRGVWLDRGELDKIIDRSLTDTGARTGSHSEQRPPHTQHNDYDRREQHRGSFYKDGYKDEYRDEYRDDSKHHGYHKKKKRDSFLDDLFDFG